MRIHVLDPHLANQIAAGEVVERPASIVKELFENCVDAGASQIVIEVAKGGQSYLCVSDDGGGIHADDLLLAVRRHSTSKISQSEDLFAVSTLGFRGEALASIAAVSRFRLSSRIEESTSGFSISIEGGELVNNVTPVAQNFGTRVEVRDIFYNVPARRKFMRTAKTEFLQIESVVDRLCLSHFQISVKLIHNGKIVLDLPAAETDKMQHQRVEKILGSAFMEQAISLDFSAAGMRLWGWAALPNYSRSQGDMQYFYINQRNVRDKLLNRSVRSGYEDILYHGRYPAYVLFLECDPATVDVNAHPSKQEVRLRDSRLVHDFIARGLRDAFGQLKTPLSEELSKPEAKSVPLAGQSVSTESEVIFPADAHHDQLIEVKEPCSEPMTVFFAEEGKVDYQSKKSNSYLHSNAVTVNSLDLLEEGSEYAEINPQTTQTFPPQCSDICQQEELPLNTKQECGATTQISSIEESSCTFVESAQKTEFLLGFALAQLHQTFILAQNQQGLVIVDLHAAHERILYERMKRQLEQEGLPTQRLLVPFPLTLSAQEMRVWEAHEVTLSRLGIVSMASGPRHLVVRELPALLKNEGVDCLLHDILADLSAFAVSERLEHFVNTVLGNMACRAAIKAGHVLSLDEMNAILRDMEQTPNSGFCNHGRPTWVQWRLKELDKFFLRGR